MTHVVRHQHPGTLRRQPVDSARLADAESLSDEELIRRFRRQGDADAFETIVHRYEAELFGYLRRSLGSVEIAEDVFQATFLQVYLKCDSFDEARRFRPWLYAIAANKAIDAQRRNRRHRMTSLDRHVGWEDGDAAFVETLADDDTSRDTRVEDEDARDWARSAVSRLPEPMKTVLVLVYHQGLKYREASDALGIPLGTVKSRVHAAIQRLNEGWREECLSHRSGAVAVVSA